MQNLLKKLHNPKTCEIQKIRIDPIEHKKQIQKLSLARKKTKAPEVLEVVVENEPSFLSVLKSFPTDLVTIKPDSNSPRFFRSKPRKAFLSKKIFYTIDAAADLENEVVLTTVVNVLETLGVKCLLLPDCEHWKKLFLSLDYTQKQMEKCLDNKQLLFQVGLRRRLKGASVVTESFFS